MPIAAPAHVTRWRAGAVELTYTDSGGAGDPVLLLHGGGLADWLTPLAADPTLRGDRVIRLVRAGYTDAPVPDGLTVDGADHLMPLTETAELGRIVADFRRRVRAR